MEFIPPIRNLYQHISELAEKHNKDALLACDENGNILDAYDYQKLKHNIDKIGSWFTNVLNLKAGDTITLGLHNCAELLLISWAAWSLGIITAPLDVRRDTKEQHRFKINLTKPKLLIADDSFDAADFPIEVINVNQIKNLPEPRNVNWLDTLEHKALILFTSGTTAHPKGAMLTLKNLIANADGIRDWFKITQADRFMVLLPLHHINSTSFTLATLLAGGCVAVPPAYSSSKFWQQAANSESTFTSLVPTICFDQLSRIEEFGRAKNKLKLNRIQIGSAPVIPSDVKKFIEQFKIPMYQGYGQTETALRVTGVSLDLDEQTYKILAQENSIGKQMKWVEAVIMDREGSILPENKEGEIAAKGPVIMEGYINADNNEAFKNGYFLTGDLGYYKIINNEKYFFIKGRLKEIIIKGGVNISPASVENRLKEINPDIDQVYVVGVPDRRYGEEVAAVICWKNGDVKNMEFKLKNQLMGQLKNITPFEVPKFIASITPDKLPITSTGKVQRSVLKTIPQETFQPINLIASNEKYKFLRLTTDNKPLMKQALELFNHCWHPLAIDKETFEQHVANGIVIACVSDKLEGMISILRTGLGEDEMSRLTYNELTGNLTMSTCQHGDKIVCVSVCSANYKRQNHFEVNSIPGSEEIRKYLKFDPVYNFHLKSKGGIGGAKLLYVLQNSRPEDTLSLGYNLLLKYPELPKDRTIVPDQLASPSVQLIEAAMHYAQQLGISSVLAFSRPAGASQHFAIVEKSALI